MIKHRFIDAQVANSRAAQRTSPFLRRLVVMVVDREARTHYASAYPTKCVQTSVAVQRLLARLGITSRVLLGAFCAAEYYHEPNVATLRFWRRYVGDERLTDAQRAQVPTKEAAAHDAPALMDAHLTRAERFAATRFTIADIALYAYTHVAGEGGADMARHPNVRDWLGRVEALPGHVAMML